MSLQSAIAYAQAHHAGQHRKTGEPYIDHPLRVLSILKWYDLDEEILMAAVLHDVNEGTDSTNPELERIFGGIRSDSPEEIQPFTRGIAFLFEKKSLNRDFSYLRICSTIESGALCCALGFCDPTTGGMTSTVTDVRLPVSKMAGRRLRMSRLSG